MPLPRFSASDLDELQQQLAAWRRGQAGRPRLPEQVWSAAAALAQTHGVSRVSRTLGLDYHRLRRRSISDPVITPAPAALPTFVELRLENAEPPLRGVGPFRIELAEARGARMTLELGHDVPAVLALAEAFWRRIP